MRLLLLALLAGTAHADPCTNAPATIFDAITWPGCHLDGPPYRLAAASSKRHACRTEIADVGKPADVVYLYKYDAQGNLVEELQGKRKTTYTYRDGHLDTYTYNGARMQVRYDKGRYVGNTRGKQHEDLSYDDRGRLVKLSSTQDDGRTFVKTYTYDADGRLHTHADDFETTTYTYDAQGRLASTTTGRYALRYTYAPDGKLASLDENDAHWAYRYENGLLTWEDLGTPVTRRIHHIYDCQGK